MKQPAGRAPKEIGTHSIVKLREIERGGLKNPWKVRLEWRDHEGNRRYKDENNWPHAEARARQIARELDEQIHIADADSVTFGKAWRAWMAESEQRHRIGDLRGNTVANYRWSEKHLMPAFERRKLNKITSQDVEKWVREISETLARHSVHNMYTYLILVLDLWRQTEVAKAQSSARQPGEDAGQAQEAGRHTAIR